MSSRHRYMATCRHRPRLAPARSLDLPTENPKTSAVALMMSSAANALPSWLGNRSPSNLLGHGEVDVRWVRAA